MDLLLDGSTAAVLVAAFVIGLVVGMTGMGGGALMTPALIFLGVGHTAAIVTADLTAAAVYKTGGALVHAQRGAPDLQLVKWLVLGSVPTAFVGPLLLRSFVDPDEVDAALQLCIGFALLLAALTYAARIYMAMRQRARGTPPLRDAPLRIQPTPTVLVGAVGGLLVGITSVGSGSVIMVALLLLYPGLSAVRMVGTDLVQAVPLVLAAAVANVLAHGIEWSLTVTLILGSVPGTILGSRVATRVPQGILRRGIVIALTVSGLAMLDKAGWAPLGRHDDSPLLILGVAVALLVVIPLAWAVLRKSHGLPAFYRPASRRSSLVTQRRLPTSERVDPEYPPDEEEALS